VGPIKALPKPGSDGGEPDGFVRAVPTSTVTDDALPPDVYAVLDQLLGEAADAIADGEYDTARSAIDSVATVTENKVPAGPPRARLEHCCETVTGLLAEGEEDDAVAREYLRAMGERLSVEGN